MILEVIFMNKQLLVIAEYHPTHTESLGQAIHQAITIWLTKELHK